MSKQPIVSIRLNTKTNNVGIRRKYHFYRNYQPTKASLGRLDKTLSNALYSKKIVVSARFGETTFLPRNGGVL